MRVAVHQPHDNLNNVRHQQTHVASCNVQVNTFAMPFVFPGPAVYRPFIGLHHCPPSFYRYVRPWYPVKWFSQSSQVLARPKHYTPQQIAAVFTDHYGILGLSNNATDKEIRSAYKALSLRFHPDMMRNADSQEVHAIRDPPEFVKVSTSSNVV